MYKLQHDAIVPADLPRYWPLLDQNDMQQYLHIRSVLMSPYGKNFRNKIDNFSDVLLLLRNFCIKGDNNDWKRFLVAGIIFFDDSSIAINTHQLKLFLGKCKSSINGSIHKLGYNFGVERCEASALITKAIPFLKEKNNDLRQWTYRSLYKKSICETSSLPSQQTDCESGQGSPLPEQQTIYQIDYSDSSHVKHQKTDNSLCLENYSLEFPLDECYFELDC